METGKTSDLECLQNMLLHARPEPEIEESDKSTENLDNNQIISTSERIKSGLLSLSPEPLECGPDSGYDSTPPQERPLTDSPDGDYTHDSQMELQVNLSCGPNDERPFGGPCSRPSSSSDLSIPATYMQSCHTASSATYGFQPYRRPPIFTYLQQMDKLAISHPSHAADVHQNQDSSKKPTIFFHGNNESHPSGDISEIRSSQYTSQSRDHRSQRDASRYSGTCSILDGSTIHKGSSIPSPPFSGRDQGICNTHSQFKGPNQFDATSCISPQPFSSGRKSCEYEKTCLGNIKSVNKRRPKFLQRNRRNASSKKESRSSGMSYQKSALCNVSKFQKENLERAEKPNQSRGNQNENSNNISLIQMILANAQKLYGANDLSLNLPRSGLYQEEESLFRLPTKQEPPVLMKGREEDKPKKTVEQNPLLFKLLSEND